MNSYLTRDLPSSTLLCFRGTDSNTGVYRRVSSVDNGTPDDVSPRPRRGNTSHYLYRSFLHPGLQTSTLTTPYRPVPALGPGSEEKGIGERKNL